MIDATEKMTQEVISQWSTYHKALIEIDRMAWLFGQNRPEPETAQLVEIIRGIVSKALGK